MKRSGKIVLAAITAALLILPADAFWGANGHRIVGEIAQRHLSEKTLRALESLMGSETLAMASTFPDEIRSDPRWDFATPWHYISVDDDETIEGTARAPEGDLLRAMDCFERVLRDPEAARPDKIVAVRYLTHFVGDLHQPLHVGRRGDRGGNGIRVNFFRRGTNLHSVWDSGLIEQESLSFNEFADFIDNATLPQIREWQSGTIRDWAQESKDYRSRVYDFGGQPADGDTPDLSWTYAFKQTPLMRIRLLQAGIRLAGIFNSIYDGDSSPPRWSHPGDDGSDLGCRDLGSRLGTAGGWGGE